MPSTAGRTGVSQCNYDPGASAVLGAVLGGALGLLVAGKDNRAGGAAVGALVGAVAGAGIGSYLQERCERLAAARAKLEATSLDYGTVKLPTDSSYGSSNADANSGIVVSANNPTMFDVGSATLTPVGQQDMLQIARAFAGTNRRILIVGHTDSTGLPGTNLTLSEQRAIGVARLFQQIGVSSTQIYYKGAGASQPIATNFTTEGRARNRRVEIVELGSEDSILEYDHLASSNPDYLTKTITQRTDVEAAHESGFMPGTIGEPVAGPSKKSATAGASDVASRALPAHRKGTWFDLGGNPVNSTGAELAQAFGSTQRSGGGGVLSAVIPSAFAASSENDPLIGTACIADDFSEAGQVRSLATGSVVSHRIASYMPGLYGTTWTKTLNGNLVGLTNVSVLRDGGRADLAPQAYVFAHYKPGQQKPTLSATGSPKSYLGSKGVLYRIFFAPAAWPLRCADIVFSIDAPDKAAYGRLYYEKDGIVYGVDFQPDPVTTKIGSLAQ